MNFIEEPTTDWNQEFTAEQQKHAVEALEEGRVLFFPKLNYEFDVDERQFLSPDFVSPNSKNVSYDAREKKIQGVNKSANNLHELKSMMHRYSETVTQFVNHLIPHYQTDLQLARTSYRPVEVKDRSSSYRKDDKRLHVDAFPSTPMGGSRILRVFSNVNHLQHPRVWRVGEPFEKVAARFLPDIRKPFPYEAEVLNFVKATRTKRTAYDHYMLNIHHKMKADSDYQENAHQIEFRFPPGSTWIVYTDQVSHAAMTGQFLLEQSFYLPVTSMANPDRAPLRVLEKSLGRELL